MAKTYKYTELESVILNGAHKALNGPVKKIVSKELQQQAKKAKHNPHVKRREKPRNNGLGTLRNIVSDTEEYLKRNGTGESYYILFTKDITTPQESVFGPFAQPIRQKKDPTLFSHWINDNEDNWMDLKSYFMLGCPPREIRVNLKRKPRPYVDTAFENICNNNSIVSQIKKYIR